MTQTFPEPGVPDGTDVAELLAQLTQMRSEMTALKNAQPAPVMDLSTFTRAVDYDETDDPEIPMIVLDVVRHGEVIRHRVKVSEWARYQVRHAGDLVPVG